MKNELTPSPSGQAFRQLFSKEINVNQLPYMHSYSLNKDIVLYRAMLIVLANRLGILQTHINLANQDDSVSDSARVSLVKKLNSAYQSTAHFMQSKPMIALRDNEYASNYHENGARSACFKFLKE